MLIPWPVVINLCPNITGIIHVGAHKAEERKVYKNIPCKWVEADHDLFEALPVKHKYHFAATDHKGFAVFNIMPFKAANSLLEPNLNAKRRKDVYVEDRVIVPCDTISSIQESGYNFLNLDIQGSELDALKGCDLSQINYIYTEVHDNVMTYHNCSQLKDIQAYLKDYDMKLIQLTKHKWGDALFIRRDI